MKIRIFRKQCFLSLIGIVISLVCDFIFVANSEWILLAYGFLLILALILIFIGYYQVVIFYPNNIVLVTNFKKSRNLPYTNIAFAYIATITTSNRKVSKWIVLCENGQEHNRINYNELLLPIKKNSLICFKYSKKRKSIITQFNIVIKNVVIDNTTGSITPNP